MLFQEANQQRFGTVQILKDSEQFLMSIDGEDKNVYVIILLYEPNSDGCRCAIKSVEILARQYLHYKFCMVRPSFISMSDNFRIGGVPAILAYKAGQLLANFVKLTNDLGTDFESSDLESYLIEHGILNDRNLIPNLCDTQQNSDSSDDE